MPPSNNDMKYCAGCQRNMTWSGFMRHLNYAKNSQCKAIWKRKPNVAAENVSTTTSNTNEASTAAKRPVPASKKRSYENALGTGSMSCPDSPGDEGFPLGNGPESPMQDWVNTHEISKQPKRKKCAPPSPIKTRARRKFLRDQEVDKNQNKESENENLVDNDNHGDCTDDEETGDEPTENDKYMYNNPLPLIDGNTDATPDTTILDDFEKYCAMSKKDRLGLPPDLKAATQLMALLSKKRVPLNVYDEVFKWHLDNQRATKFITRKHLIKKLNERYNMDKAKPVQLTNLRLPFSGSRINLVIQDAKYQIQLLLTDPRIKDNDYLFFDDNPFAPPPNDFTEVADINSGRCYRETYKHLIKDPSKQVLLPIIFYMDGAVTGQFDTLPIHSLKMTLGIFNQVARDKAHTWRSAGYLTSHLKEKTQAEDLILSAEHMDAQNYLKQETINLFAETSDDLQTHHAAASSGQDMHFMLGKMLEPYKELQDAGGFLWKLCYKGKLHDVHFIPFVMFVKGDAVELDKHCGSYTSRTENVSQLCRYCTCPNAETDNPWKRWPRKSPQMIQPLVDSNDLVALKELSQQCIHNVWYPLRFGLHNKLSIHGASPLEILHWLDIGKFKYTRENLFNQLGESSELGRQFNTVMASVGFLFARQSNRDMPRTMFTKGLNKGKLQGHEMSGLMLVAAASFRTQQGRSCFPTYAKGEQKEVFTPDGIKKWVEFIERMLQWEAWLKSTKLSVEDVYLSEVKVQDLMQMEKDIGRREKGMGCKTLNYHATMHMAEDILDFGVPNNLNTSSNEMHHKPDKTAAIRTQRQASLFDMQCAMQVHNMRCIELGIIELTQNLPVWNYFDCVDEEYYEDVDASNDDTNATIYDEITGEVLFQPQEQVVNKNLLTGTKVTFG